MNIFEKELNVEIPSIISLDKACFCVNCESIFEGHKSKSIKCPKCGSGSYFFIKKFINRGE